MNWMLSLWRRLIQVPAMNDTGEVGSWPGAMAPDGRLKLELARARRHERPLSLLVLGIRPRPGQSSDGDAGVPRRLASLGPKLGEYVRETDAAWWIQEARHFVVLLPECETDAARLTGTRIVRDLRTEVGGDLDYGIAEYPKDGLAIRDLLKQASGFLRTPDTPDVSGRDLFDIVTSDA